MEPSLERARIETLKFFGLAFRDELSALPHRDALFLYEPGVIQTGEKLKGPVLKAILSKLKDKPSKVIFIDDRLEQVQSVEEACKDMSLPAVSFHYTAFNDAPFLDKTIAHKQLEHLVKAHEWLSADKTTSTTTDCFLVMEGNKTLATEGSSCGVRYSPVSTFKIPLAVIGYDSGVLVDENHPIWKSTEPVTFLKDYWEGEKTPSSWMRFSIVWYSQMLTTKLGMPKFKDYITKLNYGNMDLSGNPGKNDGLTEAWLSSSLLISPTEQISFIEKLAREELPLSKEAQIKTKTIIRLFDESLLSDGWVFYGKSGTDVNPVSNFRMGYFVGFGQKDKRTISFVIHLTDDRNSKISGIYAKKMALQKLQLLLN